jgi:hypothetical protein
MDNKNFDDFKRLLTWQIKQRDDKYLIGLKGGKHNLLMNKEMLTIILSFYDKLEELEKKYQFLRSESDNESLLFEIETNITSLKKVIQQLEYSLYVNLKAIYKPRSIDD